MKQKNSWQRPKTAALISDDNKYRYWLFRRWDKNKPYVMFIMLNPSTADATRNDPTVRRVINFASDHGYGGVYIVNLFAWRATDPAQLTFKLMNKDNIVGVHNDRYIQMKAKKCQDVVFAWGAHGKLQGRDKVMIKMFPKALCLGRSIYGNPNHPLYLPKDTDLIPFKK